MQRAELRQLLSSFPTATEDERKSYISEPANYEYIDLRLLLERRQYGVFPVIHLAARGKTQRGHPIRGGLFLFGAMEPWGYSV